MDDTSERERWVLIAVLLSTVPLTESLALGLQQVAYELHKRDEGEGSVREELVNGVVRNLKREVAMGSIAGPLFEAEVDTARGSGKVRFVLTRRGVEMLDAMQPPPAALN